MAKWLIIKTIFKIHPLFYLVGFICFITGHFKLFIIFTSIILIHELGHIIAGIILKWKIEKVIILPFGGITIFNENLNKPLIEDLIIALMGPIFQIIYYFIIKDSNFRSLNLNILLFNLLPIIPLDGSKILNIFLNLVFPFKKSHLLTLIFSLILIFLLISKNLVLIVIFLFILIEIIKEYNKHEYYFNKFLLERYLYNFNFNKIKKINNIKKMYKNKKHIILYNKKYYLEKELLMKMFDKQDFI